MELGTPEGPLLAHVHFSWRVTYRTPDVWSETSGKKTSDDPLAVPCSPSHSVAKVRGGQVSSTKEAVKRKKRKKKKTLPTCDLLPKNTPLLNTFSPSFLPPPPSHQTKAAGLLTGRRLGPPSRPAAWKEDKPAGQRHRHTRMSSCDGTVLSFTKK